MSEQPTNTFDPEDVIKAFTDVLGILPVEQIPAVKEILATHGLVDLGGELTAMRDTIQLEILDGWIKALHKADRNSQEFRYHRRRIIHQICTSFGYTIKEGEKDLKEYVYKAAEALLDRVERHYRKVGALAVFRAGEFDNNTVEKYQAMEDRSRWTLAMWIQHLGGQQEENHTITFGSWMAVGKLLELYSEEHVRNAVLSAAKPIIHRRADVVRGTEDVREKLGELLSGRVVSLVQYDAFLNAIANEAGVGENDNWVIEVRPTPSGQTFVSLSVNGRYVWGINDNILTKD